MAVIIGGGTIVSTSLFPQGGITAVSFGIQPNINRMWQLGSFSVYDTTSTSQRNLSITAYGKKANGQGGSQVTALTPSTSCADAGTIIVTITPGECDGAVDPFTDDFFATSYSYSKDRATSGQESWSFNSKPIHDSYVGNIYMLRGIATGQYLYGGGVLSAVNMGIVVDETSSKDSNGNWIEGETGSVSAGSPGIGDYDVTREVVFSQVGGSISVADGYKGNAQVQIPYTPVYT
jgi:hypothetical protein